MYKYNKEIEDDEFKDDIVLDYLLEDMTEFLSHGVIDNDEDKSEKGDRNLIVGELFKTIKQKVKGNNLRVEHRMPLSNLASIMVVGDDISFDSEVLLNVLMSADTFEVYPIGTQTKLEFGFYDVDKGVEHVFK